ncbi:MAG TPA: NUDIX hydrolase [Rhizomicrobium sp.]|jgi:8-oxo-dGTP pyrophosphatase MutT (NUDIX family)
MKLRTSSDERAAPEAELKTLVANHLQYAALPWRYADKLEILLITSRRSKRWIVPKGWPIEGLSPQASAAQEALEEGGIVGKVSSTVLGAYHYFKRLKNGVSIPCKVVVFPLEVTRMRRNWPEKPDRTLRWCSPHDAANAVTESDLKLLIRRFARHHHGADASVAEK